MRSSPIAAFMAPIFAAATSCSPATSAARFSGAPADPQAIRIAEDLKQAAQAPHYEDALRTTKSGSLAELKTRTEAHYAAVSGTYKGVDFGSINAFAAEHAEAIARSYDTFDARYASLGDYLAERQADRPLAEIGTEDIQVSLDMTADLIASGEWTSHPAMLRATYDEETLARYLNTAATLAPSLDAEPAAGDGYNLLFFFLIPAIVGVAAIGASVGIEAKNGVDERNVNDQKAQKLREEREAAQAKADAMLPPDKTCSESNANESVQRGSYTWVCKDASPNPGVKLWTWKK